MLLLDRQERVKNNFVYKYWVTLDKPSTEHKHSLTINGTSFRKRFQTNRYQSLEIPILALFFQFHQLLPEFTALEKCMYPCLYCKKKTKKETEQKSS